MSLESDLLAKVLDDPEMPLSQSHIYMAAVAAGDTKFFPCGPYAHDPIGILLRLSPTERLAAYTEWARIHGKNVGQIMMDLGFKQHPF